MSACAQVSFVKTLVRVQMMDVKEKRNENTFMWELFPISSLNIAVVSVECLSHTQ